MCVFERKVVFSKENRVFKSKVMFSKAKVVFSKAHCVFERKIAKHNEISTKFVKNIGKSRKKSCVQVSCNSRETREIPRLIPRVILA